MRWQKKLLPSEQKLEILLSWGLAETVSTRLLVDAAKLIKSGLPKRLSIKVAMIEPLTDDEQTLEALYDLADLMI